MAGANWFVGRIHGDRLEELVGLVGVASCFLITVLIGVFPKRDGQQGIVFDILSKKIFPTIIICHTAIMTVGLLVLT